MKLSEREQRILTDLDHDLTVDDPQLAELFADPSRQPVTGPDPELADLYARLFLQSRHRRRHRVTDGLARWLGFRAR